MITFRPKTARTTPPDGRGLKRLEFEMALEIADNGQRQIAEILRDAAQSVGGDLIFILPAPDGTGESAMIRLFEDERSSFVQVRSHGRELSILDETEIDVALLGFARTSIALLERLRDHRNTDHNGAPAPDTAAGRAAA